MEVVALGPRSLLLASALFMVSGTARAEPTDALAESLFREGKRLFESGRYDEACPKLVESQRLDPRTGTLLANAICHEAQGKVASAWSEYAAVAARARREGNDEREAQARAKVAALEPQLSTLTLTPAPALAALADVSVQLDGQTLGSATLGTPLALDPGVHEIAVRAPGRRMRTWQITLGSAERQALTLIAPEPASSSVAIPSAPIPRAPSARTERMRSAGIALGSIGLAGLAVATGTGVRALRRHHRAESRCDERGECQGQRATDDWNDARRLALVANVSGIGGGLLAATGATLLITALRRGRREARHDVTLAPQLAPGTLGLSLRRAF